MPNVNPPTTTAALFEQLLEGHKGRAVVDYNHNPSPTNLDEVPGLAALGCLGFKLFMVIDGKRDYPHMPGLGISDHSDIAKILERTRETGRPLMVHPNDQALLELIEHRHWEAELTGRRAVLQGGMDVRRGGVELGRGHPHRDPAGYRRQAARLAHDVGPNGGADPPRQGR